MRGSHLSVWGFLPAFPVSSLAPPPHPYTRAKPEMRRLPPELLRAECTLTVFRGR